MSMKQITRWLPLADLEWCEQFAAHIRLGYTTGPREAEVRRKGGECAVFATPAPDLVGLRQQRTGKP